MVGLLALGLALSGWQDDVKRHTHFAPAVVAIHSGRVIVIDSQRGLSSDPLVWEVDLNERASYSAALAKKYRLPFVNFFNTRLHGIFAHGCLWANWGVGHDDVGTSFARRIPLEELDWFLTSNKDGKKAFEQKYRESFDNLIAAFGWALDSGKASPVLHAQREVKDAFFNPEGVVLGDVYYDVLPTGPRATLCFTLRRTQKKPIVAVWRGEAPAPSKPDHWWEPKWKMKEEFDSKFLEVFISWVSDDTYYFVTGSGKAFHAPPAANGKRRMLPYPPGKKMKVASCVTETKSNRLFLFGKDEDDGQGNKFFLVVGKNPKLVNFSQLSLTKFKVAEPLRSALEYAHVLATHKQIEIAPAK